MSKGRVFAGDFGYDELEKQSVEIFGRRGDLLIFGARNEWTTGRGNSFTAAARWGSGNSNR